MPRLSRAALPALLVAVTLAVPSGAAGGPTSLARSGDAYAAVYADRFEIGNGQLRIVISTTAGTRLNSLSDPVTGREWARGGPTFQLDTEPLAVDSTMSTSVEAQASVISGGVNINLTELIAGLLVVRSFDLRSGSAFTRVSSWLVPQDRLPRRLHGYRIALVPQMLTGLSARAEQFHGGSDWREDYRRELDVPPGTDVEGQLLRVGDRDGGVVVGAELRSGALARVGRTFTGTAYAGTDYARDVFDLGPLKTDPPTYNRIESPLPAAPVRARTIISGETLRLAPAYVGVYRGNSDAAAHAFAEFLARDVIPPFRRTVGYNSFHPWSHGVDFRDATIRRQADALAALGGETLMLDDQWQGGPGGESGDWQFDPVRFPDADKNGVPDIVTYVQKKGLKLGLWMSLMNFHGTSQTYAAHPDWACLPVGDVTAQVEDDAGLGVWDVTNIFFRDYITSVVDRLVATYRVGEFKFDFQSWVDCLPHDYHDAEAAFESLVTELRVRHPEVTFELDETNDQRSWPFASLAIGPSWFDNSHRQQSTRVGKVLHDVWSVTPWLPPSTLGIGLYDGTLTDAPAEFLMPLGLLTHITFWTDLTKLTPAQRATTAWWLRWYKAHRDELAGTVYRLTDRDPGMGGEWAVFQPWRGDRGYVFAFRQQTRDATAVVRLRGLARATTYQLTDVRTGTIVGRARGDSLTAGLELRLPPLTASVLSVRPVR